MIVGHERQIDALTSAIASPRMHHAWLLHGPRGVGKGLVARAAAARLLASASAVPPVAQGLDVPDDHPTAALLASGAHPDFALLERLEKEKTGKTAQNITVDQIRSLRALFGATPSQGAARAVVVDAVDDLERVGANALLKSLEEPPANTVFFLVSHASGRLLPTIRSRCRALAFSRLPDDAVGSVLEREAPKLTSSDRAAIVGLSAGSVGTALGLAEAGVVELERRLERLAESGDPDNAQRLELAGSLALKAAGERYEAFLARAPAFIADRLRERADAPDPTGLAAWSQARQLADIAVAQSLPPESVVFEIAGQVAALARRT